MLIFNDMDPNEALLDNMIRCIIRHDGFELLVMIGRYSTNLSYRLHNIIMIKLVINAVNSRGLSCLGFILTNVMQISSSVRDFLQI